MHTPPANVGPCSFAKTNDARIHRVDLDWFFFVTANLDPGIRIKYFNTNQQIADLSTKGSFSRERWSRLTHLFNLMTPHVHTSHHFSDLSSSVQKDDAMSKPNAEPITESATAKPRPVRNLSAYVQVEKDNKADCVVGVGHKSQMIKAGGNNQR